MRHIFHYLILVGLLAALSVFVARRGQLGPRPPTGPELVYENTSTPQFIRQCGRIAADRQSVVLHMLYSSDKKEWLEAAARQFGHMCPNIQVQLEALGSFEAADAIASGRLHPTLWSPSSSTALNYLENRWRQKKQKDLPKSLRQPTSLLRSPALWLMPDSRYQAMTKILGAGRSEEGLWMQVSCAMVARSLESATPTPEAMATPDRLPGLWRDWNSAPPPLPPTKKNRRKKPSEEPIEDELSGWGRVKFAHANPLRSPLGFESLYMMSYDYLVPPKARGSVPFGADARQPAKEFKRALQQNQAALLDWLRRCEGGVPEFLDSAGALAQDFFDLGVSRYDIVVVYEHVVLPILDQVRSHASAMDLMRVFYPEPTIWADHPLVIVNIDPQRESEQQLAIEKWTAFLLGEDMQNRAIELGFRPSRADASVHDHGSPQNPFLQLASRGVKINLPRRELPPADGESVEALMRIWAEATGRY